MVLNNTNSNNIGIIITICCVIAAIIILIVILVLYFSYYPKKKIEVNITNQKNMDNNDALDYYIITYGIEELLKHIKTINDWKNKKIAKCKGNEKKIKKLEARWKNYEYKAFKFDFFRNRTRYRQQNYVRYAYTVSVSTNVFNLSDSQAISRINFLKSHDYYVTYNQFTREDQRKTLTPALKEMVKKRDNYTCQICGKYMPDEVGLHIDHIIPIKKGGKSIPSNLRVLCDKCNGKKGSKATDSVSIKSQPVDVFVITCPKCGAKIQITSGASNAICPSCKTQLRIKQ